jgi:hypothetical protein
LAIKKGMAVDDLKSARIPPIGDLEDDVFIALLSALRARDVVVAGRLYNLWINLAKYRALQ